MDGAFIMSGLGVLNYEILYTAAFATTALLATHRALRLGWPLHEWLALITALVVAAVVGSKLLLISPLDWPRFLLGRYPYPVGRTFLGGAAGALFAGLALRYALDIRRPIADAFVWALPIGAMIGRVGCLIAGCCFGKPVTSGLAVAYPAGTSAFRHHATEGWISADAMHSLHVHPMPLYEIGFWMAILLTVWALRSRFRGSGSLLALALILYGALRFVGEFFRDVPTPAAGLSAFQIGLLVAIPILVLVLVRLERTCGRPCAVDLQPIPLHVLFVLLAAVSAGALIMASALSPGEWMTILAVVITGGVAVIGAALTTCGANGSPALPSLLLVVPIVAMVMAPTVPSDTTRTTYHSLSVEGAYGTLQSRDLVDWVYYDYEGCGSGWNPRYVSMDHDYTVGGLNWSRVSESPRSRSIIGLRGYAGSRSRRPTNVEAGTHVATRSIFGVNPYYRRDFRRFGLGVGLHVASGGFPERSCHTCTPSSSPVIVPDVYLRALLIDDLFGDLSVGNGIGGAYKPHVGQVGLGYGFRNSGILGNVRAGVSFVEHGRAWYISPDIPVSHNLGLHGSIVVGGNQITGSRIGLSYRFRPRDATRPML